MESTHIAIWRGVNSVESLQLIEVNGCLFKFDEDGGAPYVGNARHVVIRIRSTPSGELLDRESAQMLKAEAAAEMEKVDEQTRTLAAEQVRLRCARKHVNAIAQALGAYDKGPGGEVELEAARLQIRESLAALTANAS